ncbi:Mediator of RNA polymerase II transcription subunit 7 [Didymosphaeria variabile]|uniref:Mediator of RNA polymerase II transcription subunit 7 n=1 Tax=Didymosphaeria variabile TaxID=1932322 RepID=A0A9W8XG56_9PLEO|nr:Mediator of RNA polymerase II transcription subunit 7 [Didymosphaeria variabile]KAJ4350036.1 Mediator of RNA polymerase II transcription subunit 7 [Didymosphaeria variabile]
MAQLSPEDEDALTSYFPNPPPFYKHFTPKNIDALAQFKSDQNIENDTAITTAQLLQLPTELRYLVPPAPPSPTTEYSVFGKKTTMNALDDYPEVMQAIRTRLQTHPITGDVVLDWTYEQLYPSSSNWSSLDRQAYLFRFLRSIILSYIELLGTVAQDPMSNARDEKLKDVLTLALNMHALVNEYRPHQARETLIREMERQVERKRAEVEGVERMAERVKEVLEGFKKGIVEGKGESESVEDVSDEERQKERQREMWDVMDEVLGH